MYDLVSRFCGTTCEVCKPVCDYTPDDAEGLRTHARGSKTCTDVIEQGGCERSSPIWEIAVEYCSTTCELCQDPDETAPSLIYTSCECPYDCETCLISTVSNEFSELWFPPSTLCNDALKPENRELVTAQTTTTEEPSATTTTTEQPVTDAAIDDRELASTTTTEEPVVTTTTTEQPATDVADRKTAASTKKTTEQPTSEVPMDRVWEEPMDRLFPFSTTTTTKEPTTTTTEQPENNKEGNPNYREISPFTTTTEQPKTSTTTTTEQPENNEEGSPNDRENGKCGTSPL